MSNSSLPAAPKGRTTPMKLLKLLLILVGLAAIGVGIYFLVRTTWDMRQVMGYVNANKSNEIASPMPLIYITSALAAVGGLVLGAGLAMPRRTAKAISEGVALDGYTEATRAKAAEKEREQQIRDAEKRERALAKEIEQDRAREEREAQRAREEAERSSE
ncbi:MAG: hypothetical protein Q4G64_10305, partial [bacterium]|nr:hypothetical protein [bacterium]